MTAEPVSSSEQFLSPDHWVGALNGESKDFLTAIEAYRDNPSTANLIPSLRRFAGMGDILYFRRPAAVPEEKFREFGQHYNAAAETLTGFLLPSAEDQEQLSLQDEYSGDEWSRRLQEHFSAAAELDGRLAAMEITEQDRGRFASLAAARLIRLGQMIFFKSPPEFELQSQEFQAFFMEAMSEYLNRLDSLLVVPVSEILPVESRADERVDYSQVELTPEAEELWRQIDEKSDKYLSDTNREGFLTRLKEVSSELTHGQKEALLHRFFRKDGWMWKRLGVAVEGKISPEIIEVPALFEALAVDQPVGKDLTELLAKYSCGAGGVLGLVSRDIINELHPRRHFPPPGLSSFSEFAYREYKVALAAAVGEEGAVETVDDLWFEFYKLKEGLPREYLEPLQRAARESCPQMVAVILEKIPYYRAWKMIDKFTREDYFGRFNREEFDQVFAALARNKFGFPLLRQPETTGREEKEFMDPLHLLTNDYKDSRGAFDKELFGQYLTESQQAEFFEAICKEKAVWPESERVSRDVLQVVRDMKFYDQAEYEKLKQGNPFSNNWEILGELIPTKGALEREIARRRALVERELLINLAMTGELPVHNSVVDGLVGSGEAAPIVGEARRLAKETIGKWRQEGRRETVAPETAAEIRGGLFFGRDKLIGIFNREFSGWGGGEGLPTGQASAWGESAADKFLAAGAAADSREKLMEGINFVREKGIGDLRKLVIKGKTVKGGDEMPREFIFTEPPGQETAADGRFSIDPETGAEMAVELRRMADVLGEAEAGSLLAGIGDRIKKFAESGLAGQLDKALKDNQGNEDARAKRILGLLGNREMEPVREAIRDLAMLKLFAAGAGEFGAGRIELTDGLTVFDRIYPPLLVGEGISGVLPYSVPEGSGLTVVVGPNGGGKTMLISAMAAGEAMALTGTPPLAEVIRVPRDAEGVPLMMIGAETTTQVSRFDHSVGEARRIDQGLPLASSVTLDEAFAGTGDSYRGHLQAALAMKALAQGRPVRLTTHQAETFYQDMAALGAVDELTGLGLEGRVQWLAVDAYHRVVPGRISPFGIEMAAGAGFPTAIAENAKRLRDAFVAGTPVKMEAIKPRLAEEKRMPEWVGRETLMRLGINGMWGGGFFREYSKLPEGEGDVLGYLYQPFKNGYQNAGWEEELRFRRTMTRFMQQHGLEQGWSERTSGLRRYVEDKTELRLDAHFCGLVADLMDNFMVVDHLGDLRDKKLEAEEIFYISERDKSWWRRPERDRDYDNLGWWDLPRTLRDIRRGRVGLAAEAAALKVKEGLAAVSRISGAAGAESDLQGLAEALEEVQAEQRTQAGAVLTKAISAQAAAAVEGFYGDVSKKRGYGGLRQVLQAAGWEKKDRDYLSGSDLEYFLRQAWREGNYRLPLEVLRCFGGGGLVDGEKEMDWHRLFDGSWETELQQFPMTKTRNLDVGEVISDLGQGECGRLAELFGWMEDKDLSAEMKRRYREQYPLTMGLFNLYQRVMDVDFVQRWQDKLWGERRGERGRLIEALEQANVNLVLAAGLRQAEKTHLVFTEAGEGEEVELEGGYNPGTLQAGIDEVPQTVNWTLGQAMVVSGPNTGGKTSLAKKIMVEAALHKAMGVGVGKRIRLPKAENIGGLYASINAAETRVGEGNLASEARDVGRFLGDYLTAGCPQGVWFFGDELFTGTGQADQAGLLGAAVQAVVDSGGRCIVTTNEEGIIQSLDQAGVSHQDVRFSYRDPETQFVPLAGVGGPESFQVARDLGLDPRIVELAEELQKVQRELDRIRRQKTMTA